MRSAATGSGRRGHPRAAPSAADVGLVVAAAMGPGTFARSLSARSALDQGLVTGLSTGLHYLLAVGAQDALGAAVHAFADGGTPVTRRARTVAADWAAAPVGLAILWALPPRAEDPVRGVLRQTA